MGLPQAPRAGPHHPSPARGDLSRTESRPRRVGLTGGSGPMIDDPTAPPQPRARRPEPDRIPTEARRSDGRVRADDRRPDRTTPAPRAATWARPSPGW